MITVNGYKISEREFNMACNDFCARLNIQKLSNAQFNAILNQLIDARLMIEQAKVENINVEKSEIENILTKIKANFKSHEHFIDVLKKEGDTEDTLREKITDDLLLKSYIDAHFGKVTEEDEIQIKKYYEENKNMFKKDVQVEAAHILFDANEEKKANEVREEIINGLDFAEAAKKYSKCPSSENGGNLGYFGKGQMVPEFEKAAFSAPLGVITQPVKSQFGYHLILVTDKTDSKIQDFEEIKAGLTEHFRQSKITYEMGRVAEELRKNFDVKIDDEILEKKRKDYIAAEKDA